jgi:hypothetical protein
MKTEAFENYLEEIINQSELALDAVGELNFSVSNLNRLSRQSYQYNKFNKAVFHSIYVFLTHACTISRMIWPEISQRGKGSRDASGEANCTHSEAQITRNIKKRLGTGSRDPLKDRKLRDHFNNHMEQFGPRSVEEVSEYVIIVSPLSPDYPSVDKKLCYYDPISRNFHFRGDTYNIQETAAVIFRLLAYARDELQKQSALPRRVEPINRGLSLQRNSLVQKELAAPQ